MARPSTTTMVSRSAASPSIIPTPSRPAAAAVRSRPNRPTAEYKQCNGASQMACPVCLSSRAELHRLRSPRRMLAVSLAHHLVAFQEVLSLHTLGLHRDPVVDGVESGRSGARVFL